MQRRRNVYSPIKIKRPAYLIGIEDGRIFNSNNWSTILKNLRRDTQALIEEGRKIVSHQARIEREYSDWEDRLNQLDQAVAEMEKATGIPAQAIFDEITTPQHTGEKTKSALDSIMDMGDTPAPPPPKVDAWDGIFD